MFFLLFLYTDNNLGASLLSNSVRIFSRNFVLHTYETDFQFRCIYSWLEEIQRKQAEMVAARVTAEKMRFRDETLTAENDKLKVSTYLVVSTTRQYSLVCADQCFAKSLVDADTNCRTPEKDRRIGAGS